MTLRQEQAWAEIQESGIKFFTITAFSDYKDTEADKKAVDWDLILNEVEESEKDELKYKKEEQLKLKQEHMKN